MTEPAAAAPQILLSVGDRVVYPNQGLCTVTDIKTEEIAGQKMVFVSLQVVETGARVKAPQEKLARIGIRKLSGPDDVKRVFDFLKSDSEKASLDWKKRARDNTLRLSEGGLRGLAEVVKTLQMLSELRPLPPKERELYNDARHLVITEVAAATGGLESDAEDALDIVLFPVGKERPKRTAEEFKELGADDDGLGLGDDLLGLDGENTEETEEPAESSEDGGDEEGEAAPKKKPAKAPKAEKAPKKKKAVEEDDAGEGDEDLDEEGDGDDEGDEHGADVVDDDADAPAAPAKKRGRPAKTAPPAVKAAPATAVKAPPAVAVKTAPAAAKAPSAAAARAKPAEPKKRGRPAKPKVAAAEPAAPKKRGRPPKAK